MGAKEQERKGAQSAETDPGSPASAFRKLARADASEHAASLFDPKQDFARYLAYSRELGDVCKAKDDFASAAYFYGNAIRLDPCDVRALKGLGSVLVITKDYSGAKERYSRAVELAPNDIEARMGLGNAFYWGGEHASALEHYSKARDIEPSNPDPWRRMGLAYRGLGDGESAARCAGEWFRLTKAGKAKSGLAFTVKKG